MPLKTMRCIFSTSNNPYFNLATEEYFLKNSTDEIFLIYINEPCIVVGKHQNLLSEINLLFTINNNIKLARRISGGGTVYQDLNNLNFSFLHNCTNLEQVNFAKFTFPVVEALRDMGLNVEFSGRNDLLLDSKKISGNAMHIFKTRVLSHGTLLFNTDLNKLSTALKNNAQRYIDKSIKSLRSKVTNISYYLDNLISIEDFSKTLFQKIVWKTSNPFIQPINDIETASINQISKEKFETWDWIYGYSPKYLFRNSFDISDLKVILEMQVEKGIIRSENTNIILGENTIYQHIFEVLLNKKHTYHIIFDLLSNDKVINTSHTFKIREFCENLF
ncbi:MAG: lipoate--protein ligase [Bacteroidia bacterium]|nr:lipoate--protein ligase [Bacteroidia bacterium]